jgi:hypothetical protein
VSVISRRSAVQQLGAIFGSACLSASGQTKADLHLVRSFPGSLLDIAADSAKLCVYFGRPTRDFRISGGRVSESGQGVGSREVAIIGVDGWTMIHRTPVVSFPSFGSFFSDSLAAYLEVHGGGMGATARTLIDIRKREHRTRVTPYCTQCLSYSYAALNDVSCLERAGVTRVDR